VQKHDLGRDRVLRTLHLGRRAAEQGRLEMEDGELLLGVDARAEEDEAVRFAQSGLEWRAAAAHDNVVPGVLDDLEVV